MLNKKLVLAVDEACLVNARQKKLNRDNYHCPHCNKKVILVMSEQKAAFFKHLVKYSNLMGEKEEHHQSKMLLKSALTAAGFPAEVEIPLAEGQLRADVLATAKLAFEVQCAPLSQQEFNHRHQLYQKIGVKDIWIVGQRHYLKRRLKRTQLIFFRQNKAWGNYYLEINPQRNRFCLKYNVLEEPVANKLVYQSKSFVLDELGIKEFWSFKPFKKRIFFEHCNSKKIFTPANYAKNKVRIENRRDAL
uniref:competence protein CoiA n=1 Tax=Lactobacillus crispatus TaxID=47770 RepID=UPI001F09344E|nr:competence protein CoiA family protein [Lactobacillus crispatus]